MAQNYRVAGVRWFGKYKEGTVVPQWVGERAGNLADLAARGILVPTDAPVTPGVEFTVPEPRTAADPAPAMADELNRLRADADRLAADNKGLAAQVAALKENLAARDKALGEQTATIEHLRAACEQHQARAAELEAELEAATAPAGAK